MKSDCFNLMWTTVPLCVQSFCEQASAYPSTNGRAYATALHPSVVCDVMYYG